MKYIASFDIGTTSAKGVLVDQNGLLLEKKEVPLDTSYGENSHIEQNPEDWWEAVITIANHWWTKAISPEFIEMIVFSGQMQDCIPINEEGKPVRPAILYSDGRAQIQAERINAMINGIKKVTGNHFDGTMTFPKIKWIYENELKNYHQIFSVLISSKDYVVYQLTGKCVTDPTSAATTGMMNIKDRSWMDDWVIQQGIDKNILPEILQSDVIAGYVHKNAAKKTGFLSGTPVLCGIGDAGATTIGSGILKEGESYAYLGTTGWVANLTKKLKDRGDAIFHLAHLHRDILIAVAPITNAGNTHRWALSVFVDDQEINSSTYRKFETMISNVNPGSNGVLFYPYLNGERSLVQDSEAKGSYIGISSSTGKNDLARAVIEGTSMSIRQVLELVTDENPKNALVLLGGGSRSETWCQILADVCNKKVIVPQNAEYLPSLGISSFAFVSLRWVQSYDEFIEKYINQLPQIEYVPITENVEIYADLYKRFVNA